MPDYFCIEMSTKKIRRGPHGRRRTKTLTIKFKTSNFKLSIKSSWQCVHRLLHRPGRGDGSQGCIRRLRQPFATYG